MKTRTKKKAFRTALITIIALPLLLLLVLSALYSPVYVFRLITQNVADVYDYRYYHSREIKAASTTFDFSKVDNKPHVEKLFRHVLVRAGCQTIDEWAEKSQTTALLFIRNDTLLYEQYFNGFERESHFHSQSMAKSFISFLVGASIGDGLISSVDDKMTRYLPELLERDSNFSKISIKHLLEMRSGIHYNTHFIPGINIHAPWHDEAVGYYHPNVRKRLLENVTIATDPGKTFRYCNYNTSYLAMILERASGKSVSAYLEEKLWSKIMKYDAQFSLDSRKSGFEYVPSRLIARAEDYARFGRLYLNNGNWNGKQIISEEWVHQSTRENKVIPRQSYPAWFGNHCSHVYYAYHWWGHTNCDATFQIAAFGNLGQTLYIVPHKNIIIVRCGNSQEYYNDNDLWLLADRL